MQPGGNKEVVSRYFLQGIGELDPDVVDEVFATDHRLTSPEFGTEPETGTQRIKDAVEGFRRDASGVTCTIESQIEEGDWVATIYTLSEEHDRHLGVMISRVVDGKIQESHVAAKTVSEPDAEARLRTEDPTSSDTASTARRAFN